VDSGMKPELPLPGVSPFPLSVTLND
jgi:hypothetical protein